MHALQNETKKESKKIYGTMWVVYTIGCSTVTEKEMTF